MMYIDGLIWTTTGYTGSARLLAGSYDITTVSGVCHVEIMLKSLLVGPSQELPLTDNLKYTYY